MMNIARATAAVLMTAALAAGCTTVTPAGSPAAAPAPAAPAFDAAGTYDFNTQVSGQAVSGVVRLARNAAGAWGGSVSSPVTGELPVREVAVDGNRVRVTASADQGDLVLTLNVTGSAVAGNWTYAGQGGSLTGTRR